MAFNTTSRPAIRGRVLSKLPATLTGTGGITITKVNGVWTVKPKFSDLALVSSLTDPTSKQVWIYDPVLDSYSRMSLAVLVSLFNGTHAATEIDFGAFPGVSDVSLAITGQTTIAADSLAEAWIAPKATADHSLDEHVANPPLVFAGNVVAGVGFTIYGVNDDRFGDTRTYGRWSVNWRYQ